MKVKITAQGIFNGLGKELPIGSVIEVPKEPTAWKGRYEVVGDNEEATVDANHEDPNEAARLAKEAQDGGPETREPVTNPARKQTAAEKKAAAAAAASEPATPAPDAPKAMPAAEANPAVPAPPPATGTQPWQR